MVDVLERLTNLTLAIADKATGSFVRRIESGKEAVHQFAKVFANIDHIIQKVKKGNPEFPTGDDLIAGDLANLVENGNYGLSYWLADSDLSSLAVALRPNPKASMADLFRAASSPGDTANAISDSPIRVLLGSKLELRDLLTHPWIGRLEAIPAAAVAAGLARMIELAKTLRDGLPPDDSFSNEERDLYLALESSTLRRSARAWRFLQDLAYGELVARNDRAERLTRAWLLHPTNPPIRDYIGLLYAAYVDGHHATSVILCRAILERAVRATVDRFLHPAPPPSMMKRIAALQAAGLLTPEGADRARAVWSRGNLVVHEDPAVIKDAWDTISQMLLILDELAPRIATAQSDGACETDSLS